MLITNATSNTEAKAYICILLPTEYPIQFTVQLLPFPPFTRTISKFVPPSLGLKGA
jgi:hypothetical protein